MRKMRIFIFTLSILLCFSIRDCFSHRTADNNVNQNIAQDYPDEIIFYTTGSSFSPVLTLQSDAEVIWTWDDNTTSSSLTPVKDYGSVQVRTNRLKVTPWSAVRRINIGYDAGDNGSPDIELVANQRVSAVENLHLVAPFLKEWCSSYNKITQLDFSNFTELETIECFLSVSLESVILTNTNKLKRACFEFNNLQALDVSDSPLLKDLRAASNAFTEIALSDQTDSLWHFCVHHNQFSDPHFLNDMTRFPSMAELLIDFANQQGELKIPKTNPKKSVEIRAYGNKYNSIDFRGAFTNGLLWGIVDMDHNVIDEVNIEGCVQIKQLDLSYNELTSAGIDHVLRQMDELGTDPKNGTIDLRNNQPPTYTGWIHKTNLENKGWIVYTDLYVPVESIVISGGTTISTDNGTLQFQAAILPDDATYKNVNWSVQNGTGRATITSSGLLTAEKDGTVTVIATATDGSGVTGELQIFISNQVIPVESISIGGGTSISTDNGTLQLQVAVLPDDATNKTVNWTVQNETGQATITSSGLLTAEKDGTVRVIARAMDGSGVTGELRINISNQVVQVESISISGGVTISTDNGTLQLQAAVLPDDATYKTVNWSVQNGTGLAAITSSGLLTAEKNGTVRVIASAIDGSGVTGELQIIISNQLIPVESITISGGSSISTDNGTLQLQVTVLPDDATNKSVNWTVQNETGQATITSSGLLTAGKDGTVRVIAGANDGSGVTGELQIDISNQAIPVESIFINGGTSIATDNGTLQLQVTVLPDDATYKTVNWTVQNGTGQATITSSGLLTAEKDGTVRVIVRAEDGSGVTGELWVDISNQVILVENIDIINDLSGDSIFGIGTQSQFNVNILPVNATYQEVNWSVENITGRAEIDSKGLLSAISPGLIRVMAKAKDESEVMVVKEYVIVIPVGIQDRHQGLTSRVFPNPTSGKIEIHLEQIPKHGVKIEFWNSTGQLLIKTVIFEHRSVWSTNQFSGNVFFVKIMDNNNVITHKIIKTE